MKTLVKEHLNKSYLGFIEIIRFNLEQFRENLKDIRSTILPELYSYLETETDPVKIKASLISFLQTDYKEIVDVLLSKHFLVVSMKKQ